MRSILLIPPDHVKKLTGCSKSGMGSATVGERHEPLLTDHQTIQIHIVNGYRLCLPMCHSLVVTPIADPLGLLLTSPPPHTKQTEARGITTTPIVFFQTSFLKYLYT